MGISASLVWQKGLDNRPVRTALIIFLVQLILNALWSMVFFGLESLLGGVIVIVFLWLAILATIVAFSRITNIAAILLIPYIGWVTFAAILNIAVFILNT